ncbi:hypothetical protein WJX72_001976 [[Myrmecia] bisecta]|uniref:EF-hand domain-containing protein n=1 Tax=[Myrmecia] bisecta TaxID=41462 RepID=A0AAW1NZ76_9CHLO
MATSKNLESVGTASGQLLVDIHAETAPVGHATQPGGTSITLRRRTGNQLPASKRAQELHNQLIALDKNGDGQIDEGELASALDTLIDREKQNRQLKLLVVALVIALMVLTGAVFGVSIAAAVIVKDTRVEHAGGTSPLLTDKSTGQALVTGQPQVTLAMTQQAGFSSGTAQLASVAAQQGRRRRLQESSDNTTTTQNPPLLYVGSVQGGNAMAACEWLKNGLNHFLTQVPAANTSTGSSNKVTSLTVQLRSGAVKRMEELEVGDAVLTADLHGRRSFSEVYFFGHKDKAAHSQQVRLTTNMTLGLTASAKHFVPVCRAPGCTPASATTVYKQDVKVGDIVWLAAKAGAWEAAQVQAIDVIATTGLFNPYTKTGTIVVDGFLASCHSDWILDSLVPAGCSHHLPAVYQALFAPLRLAYNLLGAAAWASLLDMTQVVPAGLWLSDLVAQLSTAA